MDVLLEFLELILKSGRETESKEIFNLVPIEALAANGPHGNGSHSEGQPAGSEQEGSVRTDQGSVAKCLCSSTNIFTDGSGVVCDKSKAMVVVKILPQVPAEDVNGGHGVKAHELILHPLQQPPLRLLDIFNGYAPELLAVERRCLGLHVVMDKARCVSQLIDLG